MGDPRKLESIKSSSESSHLQMRRLSSTERPVFAKISANSNPNILITASSPQLLIPVNQFRVHSKVAKFRK